MTHHVDHTLILIRSHAVRECIVAHQFVTPGRMDPRTVGELARVFHGFVREAMPQPSRPADGEPPCVPGGPWHRSVSVTSGPARRPCGAPGTPMVGSGLPDSGESDRDAVPGCLCPHHAGSLSRRFRAAFSQEARHVRIPNTRYSGHHPINAVASGTRPIQPHGDCGPVSASAISPTPITTRTPRSNPPIFRDIASFSFSPDSA